MLNDYIEEQRNTQTAFTNRNLMTAYKWLAELHGVLCTGSPIIPNLNLHQKELETSLKTAKIIKDDNNLHDDHLEFLIYKKVCKVNICQPLKLLIIEHITMYFYFFEKTRSF